MSMVTTSRSYHFLHAAIYLTVFSYTIAKIFGEKNAPYPERSRGQPLRLYIYLHIEEQQMPSGQHHTIAAGHGSYIQRPRR